MELIFERVIPTLEQVELLYGQLNNRRHNISHKAAPNFAEHSQFVHRHPYREWLIVKDGESFIGSVYIKFDNAIGLNYDSSVSTEQIRAIFEYIFESFEPMPAIPSVRVGNFFLNVASSNALLQETLVKLGFSEVERTFVNSKTSR
jgi:hypothetical protein